MSKNCLTWIYRSCLLHKLTGRITNYTPLPVRETEVRRYFTNDNFCSDFIGFTGFWSISTTRELERVTPCLHAGHTLTVWPRSVWCGSRNTGLGYIITCGRKTNPMNLIRSTSSLIIYSSFIHWWLKRLHVQLQYKHECFGGILFPAHVFKALVGIGHWA